jgi:glycyl-tRNA synthetase
MLPLFDANGLVLWTEEEIKVRRMLEDYFVSSLKTNLLTQNRAFQMFQCEAPLLIPRQFVNENYTEEDIFVTQDDLVLKPETTSTSYLYAMELLNTHNDMKVKPPFVIWQHSRSARNEQDNVLKNMRLKEFYQLEFQILFSETTRNDYYPSIIEAMRKAASDFIGPCRLEQSDRLPSYSSETTDIVCDRNDMEVCSMSRRHDFPDSRIKVIEVAFGTDRCVRNFFERE